MKMNLYGKMNVTEAHLEKIGQNQPLGDQIALEQIDDKTKSIENKFIDILEHEKEENNLTHIGKCKMKDKEALKFLNHFWDHPYMMSPFLSGRQWGICQKVELLHNPI